ncbi:Gst Glutathione S-transferase [Sphingomonadaceae bacterium]|jgi:glutathione S-transferase|uniref:glutathione S-transferase family protein n=1 Tax=Sphingorhabdus sp. TaxID=1902408 RepID=UPI003084B932|nr:glutathione S-transferase family protein [Sphingomonadales bacterium]WRH75881.1 MAG: glutathione S-transferase family protein [Sphingobium sp.]
MWQLLQFPLCPFSRKVRLQMGEKGIAYSLVRENPWEHRDDFLYMNPAARTPVLIDPARNLTLADSVAIGEYIEEISDTAPMISGSTAYRAEIRRLVAWFDQQFFGDVTAPLLHERMKKRIVHRQPPDSNVLREAMRLANGHLDYIDYLIDHRAWMAGPTMSMADLAAAAQISVADYLGGIDWSGHEQTKSWYSMFKSRPSFRPLLSERMESITPPPYYEQVDF